MSIKLKLGADPELFLYDTGHNLVSAYGKIAGTKYSPFPVSKGAVQVDGIALEYNIEPADNLNDFIANNETVLQALRGMIGSEYDFGIDASVRMSNQFVSEQPPESLELGCEPSYNAYSMRIEESPEKSTRTRGGAGHIHMGWTEGVDPLDPTHFAECAAIVRQLDALVELPRIARLSKSKCALEAERRYSYGKAGSFRPKSYGLEYRVPSNDWVGSRAKTTQMFNGIQKTFNDMVEGKVKLVPENYYNNCISVINRCNATYWGTKNKLKVVEDIRDAISL